MRKPKLTHPFLFTDGKKVYAHHKKDRVINPPIGLYHVVTNRHHLYPKDREEIEGINKERFLLRLWDYKHFYGWNKLFQFCYHAENGKKKCHELNIDEIITLMIIKHPFIVQKVGSVAWKILFRQKTLEEARDLLCRMLYFKFKHEWKYNVSPFVELAVQKAA